MNAPAELLPLFELLLKMALTAGVVVAASMLAERSGAFLGAMIACLPTAAGAAYVILALEHPPAFIAQGAIGSIGATAAVGVFALVYASLARRHGVAVSLGASLATWLGCAISLRAVDWTLGSVLLLSLVVFSTTAALSQRLRQPVARPTQTRLRMSDVLLRAGTTALVVAVVTTISDHIGSFLSGVFALFPVVMGSLAAVLQPRIGGPATSNVFANAQGPLFGLVVGFVAVNLLAGPLGVWWALFMGLAVCLGWNALLWALNRTRPAAPAAGVSRA